MLQKLIIASLAFGLVLPLKANASPVWYIYMISYSGPTTTKRPVDGPYPDAISCEAVARQMVPPQNDLTAKYVCESVGE